MPNFDSTYEVFVLEGERWHVKHVSRSQGDAMATAIELSKRIGIQGVRVIKDFHDRARGLSFEKVLFEQIREKSASRVRASRG